MIINIFYYMTDNFIIKSLSILGVPDFEAEVYGELILNPEINLGKICTKLSTYKVRLYEAINRLVELGLVKKYGYKYNEIQPESPSKILELIREKERNMSQLSNDFELALPSLESSFHSRTKKSDISSLPGKQNFIKLTNTILDEMEPGSTIYSLANGLDFYEVVDFFYFNGPWIKKRLAKKIKVKMIATEDNFRAKSFVERNKLELREVRFLPKDTKLSPSAVWIVDHKIINWNTVLPKAIVIEDRVLASFHIDLFEYIWSSLES